ncbi:MAG: MscS family membrane protein [Saprospiraceae bacterium]|jgi:MscS family membrane protein
MKKIILSLVLLFTLNAAVFSQSTNAPEPTLENPYNSIYVHLYYLQPESYRPDVAAVTLFRSKDSLTLIKDAIMLKQIFDGNGLFVRLNQLPQEPDYIDSTSQKSYYTPFPIELPEVYLERIGGKWLYSKETIDQISRLHKKTYPMGTDRLLTLLPTMGQKRFLGLATWQYLTIGLVILFGWLFYKILSGLLVPLGKRMLNTYFKFGILDNKKVIKIAQAISLLFLFWLIRLLIPVLQLPIAATETIILILRIALTILFVVLAIRIVRLAMDYAMNFAEGTEQRMDDQLIPIIRRSLIILFSIIGILNILHLLDVNVTALIAGVSIGGLALALAAQDTVKNLIGSAMIFFDRPFQIGDYIIGGGVEGTVKEVGFRTTRIQTLDTSIVSVPNGTIANLAITNLGVRVFRLISTTLTVTYDTSPDLIEKFIEGLKKLILSHPLTRKEGYYVHFTSLDASSLNILFRSYINVNTYADELKAKESILLGILRLAESLNVSFAFPSSSVYINTASTDTNANSGNLDEKIEKFLEDFKKRNTPDEDFLD